MSKSLFVGWTVSTFLTRSLSKDSCWPNLFCYLLYIHLYSLRTIAFLVLIIMPYVCRLQFISWFYWSTWLVGWVSDWLIDVICLSVFARADVTVFTCSAVSSARRCSGRSLPCQQRRRMQWRDDDVTVLAAADQLTSSVTLVVASYSSFIAAFVQPTSNVGSSAAVNCSSQGSASMFAFGKWTRNYPVPTYYAAVRRLDLRNPNLDPDLRTFELKTLHTGYSCPGERSHRVGFLRNFNSPDHHSNLQHMKHQQKQA